MRERWIAWAVVMIRRCRIRLDIGRGKLDQAVRCWGLMLQRDGVTATFSDDHRDRGMRANRDCQRDGLGNEGPQGSQTRVRSAARCPAE